MPSSTIPHRQSKPADHADGLLELFNLVPDPRMPRGTRHPLAVVLAAALAAVLSGARSYAAIGQWADSVDGEVAGELGLVRRPEASTFRRVLTALDTAAFDVLTGAWLWLRCVQASGMNIISFDGKTVRGATTAGRRAPHLLAAMVHGTDTVVAQVRVGEKTNEIPALRDLVKRLAIEGWLVIADALHTQRDTAQAIIEAGAGYLLTVKRNQPGLLARCAALPWTRIPHQTSVDRSKGRRVRRTIKVCDADAWADFPHAAQIAQLRRTRTERGRKTVEVVYLICSLPAAQATPAQIGRWIQAHWRIENRVHWIRDVCFDEDRQTAHSGNGPEAMAALRNLAISLLRLNGAANIAAALRHNAYHPEHVLLILLTSRKETLP